MKIGLIGRGTIGTFLIEQINQQRVFPHLEIVGVLDEREVASEPLEVFTKRYGINGYTTLPSFLDAQLDLVVECANVEAVRAYAPAVIQQKDLFLISVGALADFTMKDQLEQLVREYNRTLYLPSGAIGGLDVLRSANVLGGLESVTLTTTKPAVALSHRNLKGPKTVFEGAAYEAIESYPKNMNIAIVVSLAGIGVEKTKVKLIADPEVQKNTHQLEATGDFGHFSLRLENNPSPTNVKTSFLTSLSILASLGDLQENIVLG